MMGGLEVGIHLVLGITQPVVVQAVGFVANVLARGFLDAAGVKKREKRNNPEKAVPRKERKAAAEAAAKSA